MAGDAAYFQTQYVAALLDRALSDVGRDGKPRHTIRIIGFGSNIIFEEEITTRAEAVEFLKDVQFKTRNRSSGTDGRKVMLRARDVIEEANRKGDTALARATVVLMSDGGFDFDVTEIRNAYGKVGESTSILLAFAAINGTNEDFMDLVDRNAVGTAASMYIEWNSDDISNAIASSQKIPEPVSDFWTKSNWFDLPGNIHSALNRLERISSGLRGREKHDDFTTPHIDTLKRAVERPNLKRVEKREKNHHAKLNAFRRLLNILGPHFDSSERANVLNRVLSDLSKTIPESINDLDHYELAHLRYILGWVGSGVAGTKEDPDASK
jgi:hypothetical protein